MSELDDTKVTPEATSAPETGTPAPEKKKAPKRTRKQRQIIIGVVAAVVIVAGAGFMVWHEQPSFCNAICHTPMDPYLPTYEAEPGQPAMDKWGNNVSNASSMLAATHRVDADATCMKCHVPTLGEQVSEGVSWLTGNYDVAVNETYTGGVPFERETEDLTAARGIEADEFCLNESCHNLTRDELAEKTSYMTRNVHVAEHDKLECSDCHKAHRSSVVYCSKCHDDSTIPEGWITVAEESTLVS